MKRLIVLALVSLVGCATGGSNGSSGYKLPTSKEEIASASPQPPKPTANCSVDVKSTRSVSGTLDGKGCVYRWRGKGYPSHCGAIKEISESEPPMFEMNPGATIKNMFIECALDGIHTTKNNTIDNVVFLDVEEDAITLNENVTVKNSEFYFCQDKCLQMNHAKNANITGNKFFHANSAILANEGNDVDVFDNYFENVRHAVRSKHDSSVRVKGSSGKRVEVHMKAEDKGQIQDLGGHKVEAKTDKEEVNGGKIK